ncbi:PREDICTED: uncharacterized protein LOC109343587 isoform X2 [Lupinus angustifolius]|uniref:uncharacterized protein LOC109343587 isoform X2 n=1 Tax=Lupinus angustifolius TaxID=3871 RepID=UPI00092E8B66|nr:PREDICTED: uncharacterized protein LOC109343587 isoform X2 [Lupinus angustifolius]
MHVSSGCFGCCTKLTPIKAVDEVTNGRKIQGQTVKKPTTSDDFWSSSTHDVDNSTVQSQRSIQSVSTLNQILGTSMEGNDHEFVNRGLLLWNKNRLKWIGSDRPKNQTQQMQESRLSANASYETLLGTRRLFPKPIPLSVQLLENFNSVRRCLCQASSSIVRDMTASALDLAISFR